jgi:hypothetical protein
MAAKPIIVNRYQIGQEHALGLCYCARLLVPRVSREAKQGSEKLGQHLI